MSEATPWWENKYLRTGEIYGPPTKQHAAILELLGRRLMQAEAQMTDRLRVLRRQWWGDGFD